MRTILCVKRVKSPEFSVLNSMVVNELNVYRDLCQELTPTLSLRYLSYTAFAPPGPQPAMVTVMRFLKAGILPMNSF
jgi:hypothetical protein